jgi:predicted aspartyl protease
VPILVRSLESGREVVLEAAVDTGSNVTVLEGWVADDLKLDLSRASRSRVIGLGGVVGNIALAEVEVALFSRRGLRATVLAAFLPSDSPPIGNLLGTDLLEQLDFGLSHANDVLYFGLPA